jgi:ParB/RepB/Spo0J family partition protein
MEEFRTAALADLYESPMNTRRHFDAAALNDLTESVRSKGVLVPLLVREKEHRGKKLEILAGARRYRAAKNAEGSASTRSRKRTSSARDSWQCHRASSWSSSAV